MTCTSHRNSRSDRTEPAARIRRLVSDLLEPGPGRSRGRRISDVEHGPGDARPVHGTCDSTTWQDAVARWLISPAPGALRGRTRDELSRTRRFKRRRNFLTSLTSASSERSATGMGSTCTSLTLDGGAGRLDFSLASNQSGLAVPLQLELFDGSGRRAWACGRPEGPGSESVHAELEQSARRHDSLSWRHGGKCERELEANADRLSVMDRPSKPATRPAFWSTDCDRFDRDEATGIMPVTASAIVASTGLGAAVSTERGCASDAELSCRTRRMAAGRGGRIGVGAVRRGHRGAYSRTSTRPLQPRAISTRRSTKSGTSGARSGPSPQERKSTLRRRCGGE